MKNKCGGWIGVLGGGQLGRMLSLDARRMGFRTLAWTGGDRSGAASTADELLDDAFDDPKALEKFTDKVEVATVEFENLPQSTLEKVEERVPLYPGSFAVATCQHREREKLFLSKNGFACAQFRISDDFASFKDGIDALSGEVIVKTAEFGYDGKGQIRLPSNLEPSALKEAWNSFDGGRVVIEERVSLAAEFSLLVARSSIGQVLAYDPVENIHRNHILDVSIAPARIPEDILSEAKRIALSIAESFNYVGILAVEFFLSADGRLLVNELAPRPHNSGHHTINACSCSQFENQTRAICGLPLGSPDLFSPVIMMNLLGDLWSNPMSSPDWTPFLKTAGCSLHLYGKREARKGRKMGHATITGKSTEQIINKLNKLRENLDLPLI